MARKIINVARKLFTCDVNYFTCHVNYAIGKINHERNRVDYRSYGRTNHTLTSLLHLYASASCALRDNVCAIFFLLQLSGRLYIDSMKLILGQFAIN